MASLQSTQSNQAASAYANYLGVRVSHGQDQANHNNGPGSRNYSNYHSSLAHSNSNRSLSNYGSQQFKLHGTNEVPTSSTNTAPKKPDHLK